MTEQDWEAVCWGVVGLGAASVLALPLVELRLFRGWDSQGRTPALTERDKSLLSVFVLTCVLFALAVGTWIFGFVVYTLLCISAGLLAALWLFLEYEYGDAPPPTYVSRPTAEREPGAVEAVALTAGAKAWAEVVEARRRRSALGLPAPTARAATKARRRRSRRRRRRAWWKRLDGPLADEPDWPRR